MGWANLAVIGWLAAIASFLWALRLRRRERRRDRLAGQLSQAFDDFDRGNPSRSIFATDEGPLHDLAERFDEVIQSSRDASDRLRREVKELRALLDSMVEAVISVDNRRRLRFANTSADTIFRLNRQSLGRMVPELIRHPKILEAVEATIGKAGVFQGEVTLAGRDASGRLQTRVFLARGSKLPGPGGSSDGALLVFHDVTELRRLERMRQDFVANASHELKTPLASIKAYTETLLDSPPDDPDLAARFLRRIDEQADRLNVLIQDMLMLARLESSQGFFQHEPMKIRQAALDFSERLRDRAIAKDLSYNIDLSGIPESALVRADEEAIRQILDNLIDNAIKYSPEGGAVRVEGTCDGDTVEIAVTDKGIGIPRDEQPRVFERFYRVDKARSRELGGTGLGLSIVKHLMEAMGGEVRLESRVGEGSRFSVHFPLAAAVAQRLS